jgi:hypothetical protein
MQAKTPKLRGRQQLTLRYRAYEQELVYWDSGLHQAKYASLPAQPRVIRFYEGRIADCEARMDELSYVLGGVV